MNTRKKILFLSIFVLLVVTLFFSLFIKNSSEYESGFRLVSLEPAGENIPINGVIYLTFSEAINSEIDYTQRVSNSSNIPLIVTVSGETMTITPVSYYKDGGNTISFSSLESLGGEVIQDFEVSLTVDDSLEVGEIDRDLIYAYYLDSFPFLSRVEDINDSETDVSYGFDNDRFVVNVFIYPFDGGINLSQEEFDSRVKFLWSFVEEEIEKDGLDPLDINIKIRPLESEEILAPLVYPSDH